MDDYCLEVQIHHKTIGEAKLLDSLQGLVGFSLPDRFTPQVNLITNYNQRAV